MRDALRNMGRYIAGANVLLCGASYREDVGDTRYSGSELVVRKLTEMGAEMHVHDPYVDHWYELENQDDYPAPGHSWSRFFRNQAALTEIRVQKDLAKALAGAEALILAVRHKPYLDLEPDQVVKWAGAPLAVVDCFGILDRRPHPPLLRAGLRGEGARPRPHPADQGRGPEITPGVMSPPMSLRIAFDCDGVVADLDSALAEIVTRLFRGGAAGRGARRGAVPCARRCARLRRPARY